MDGLAGRMKTQLKGFDQVISNTDSFSFTPSQLSFMCITKSLCLIVRYSQVAEILLLSIFCTNPVIV